RFTAAFSQGDTEAAQRFARLIPQLRGVRDETEFTEKALKLIQTGMNTLNAEVNSSAGQFRMFRRDLGNLLEDFGKFVSDGLRPVLQAGREVIAIFKEMPDDVKKIISQVSLWTASFLTLAAVLPLLKVGFFYLKDAVVSLGKALLGTQLGRTTLMLGA